LYQLRRSLSAFGASILAPLALAICAPAALGLATGLSLLQSI